MKRALLLLLAFSGIALAEVEQVGPFGPLNNTYNSFTIPSNSAQDLLNVDVSEGNKSIKKRRGYAASFTLSNATSPVHGVYNFYDASGGDTTLFFNDRRMNVSASGAIPTVFFSTGTNGATYQCVDSAGFAYCANTGRDSIIKVNSSTYSLLSGFTSTGTMLAITPERLVQSGFSSNTNLIWLSKANDFTTWTVGGNPTDPIQFTITSPGAGVKHITYAHGRVYWFKDSSFGYIQDGGTQADWKVVTVNSFLGTLYNTSIFRDDILYFQGNDGHFYGWDGSNLVKLSKDIQATIDVTQQRSLNSWSQSTQTEWQNGTSTPTSSLSITISPGSVVPSSFSITETSGADFAQGTLSNAQISGNSILLATTSTSMFNYSFEQGTTIDATDWQETGTWQRFGTLSAKCGSITPYDASFMMVSTQTGSSNPKLVADILRFSDNSSLVSSTISLSIGCNWSTGTLTAGSSIGQRVKFRFTGKCDSCSDSVMTTTSSFILGGDFTYRYRYELFNATGTTPAYVLVDYLPVGISTVTSGNYVSKVYDTGVSTSVLQFSSVSITSNTNTITFGMKTSASQSGSYSEIITATGTNSVAQRYVKYVTSFTVSPTNSAGSSFDDATFIDRSSGTFYSAVNNASNISSWDAFNVVSQDNGGSHSFSVRSATGSFVVLSTFPTWTSITAGAIPTISALQYFQMKDDFTITAATHNPSLDSFTFNWFEGSASDKTYAIYYDNANWWSVASGTGATTNNKILKFNLIDPGWYIYDIGTGGMYIRSQSLYFGSVSAGKIYKYGSVDNDDGSAITSYWKSKDFFGTSPFVDKDYQRLSTVNKAVSNSTMTVTYTLDGNSATSYNVDLGSSSSSFVQKNNNLPLGKVGRTINIKFSNTAADQPWEVFGGAVEYQSKPWTPK